MRELRQNAITRDWVIIASDRGQRPNDFATKSVGSTDQPHHQEHCPFCPGNEHKTPNETFRMDSPEGWQIRVVPNRFAVLASVGKRERTLNGTFRAMPAEGTQEVIVEHPRHDLTTALMSVQEVYRVLHVYRERYTKLTEKPGLEAIIIFKNHGENAGTSLEHPHSQIIATPVVPNQVRNRIEEAMRHYDDTGECIFCRTLREELAAQDRVVIDNEHFVAFVPYAALSPYHIWIYPRRHTSIFSEISDNEIWDLASILKAILAKLYHGLNNPDYNYVIRSNPIRDGNTSYFHWYISIIPRISKTAGFELGSGMFINSSLPEEDASRLRDVKAPN